jgi:hypothetical protein
MRQRTRSGPCPTRRRRPTTSRGSGGPASWSRPWASSRCWRSCRFAATSRTSSPRRPTARSPRSRPSWTGCAPPRRPRWPRNWRNAWTPCPPDGSPAAGTQSSARTRPRDGAPPRSGTCSRTCWGVPGRPSSSHGGPGCVTSSTPTLPIVPAASRTWAWPPPWPSSTRSSPLTTGRSGSRSPARGRSTCPAGSSCSSRACSCGQGWPSASTRRRWPIQRAGPA